MGDVTDLYFHSSYPIDKIIGYFEGSFVASAPGGGIQNRTTDTFATLITESTFYDGIYTIDGGTTWRNIGTAYRVSGSTELLVFGYSNANSFTVGADNFSFVGGNDYTVEYKVILIAKTDQGDITPQPIGADILFDSRQNYQKILLDTSQAISITNGNETTYDFAHDLGYIPKVRSFIELGSDYGAGALRMIAGLYEASYCASDSFSAGASAPGSVESTSGIYIDTSDVHIVLNNNTGRGNFSGTLFMRVYYDA